MRKWIKVTLTSGRDEVYLNPDNIVSIMTVHEGTQIITNSTAAEHRKILVTENAGNLVKKVEGKF